MLSLTIFLTTPLAAQNGLYQPVRIPAPIIDTVRPSADLTGREAYPMLYIDEATFSAAVPDTIPYPALAWVQAKTCYEHLTGELVTLQPPELRVVPAAARTFRVRDITIDSLNYADDSTYAGEHWSPPTIGYTFMHSKAVLIAARYQTNIPVLRHEALHWIIWNQKKVLGHPPEFFNPCDRYYGATN